LHPETVKVLRITDFQPNFDVIYTGSDILYWKIDMETKWIELIHYDEKYTIKEKI